MSVIELLPVPQQLTSPVFAAGDLLRGLSFERPIPPGLVHKAARSEVLLTDAVQLSEDRFTVAARWPGDHRLYRPFSPDAGDPTLVIETVRQAVIYLSHRFYDIPLTGYQFILASLETDIDYPGLPVNDGPHQHVVLDTVLTPTTTRPGRFAMEMEATVYIGGMRRGRQRLRWQAVETKRYEMVRNRNSPRPKDEQDVPPPELPTPHPAEMASAHAVGRRHERDVLITPDPSGESNVWRLVMDDSHPVYFDHHGDHVPGMVLLEAMRQAAHAATAAELPGDSPSAWAPLTLAACFELFGELDAPVTIAARRSPESAVFDHFDFHVVATQYGRPLVRARMRGAKPIDMSLAVGSMLR